MSKLSLPLSLAAIFALTTSAAVAQSDQKSAADLHPFSSDTALVATKIVVGDLESSATFYGKVFDLKEDHRGDGSVAGRTYSEVVYAPTHAGGAVLVLRRYKDKAKPSHDEAVVAFVSRDVKVTLKRVEEAGGKVVQQPIALPKHRNLNSYVTDPEGHLLEVVQLY